MKNKPTHMSEKQGNTQIALLKVGIDMHSDKYVVVVQEDALPLKNPQRFSPEGFFNWIVGNSKGSNANYKDFPWIRLLT